MHKVFMNAKEVQEFLEVSRATVYQMINEMNGELVNHGYRVQRGKVNRRYFMEKYCYGGDSKKEVIWEHTRMKQRMELGFVSSPIPIGKGKTHQEKAWICNKERCFKLGKGVFDCSF